MLSSPLVAILGPTAAGKSSLALRIAAAHGGEIISADARQIYVGMDVGTAKLASRGRTATTHDEPLVIRRIPHYLLDILTPDTPYSAFAFCRDARGIISSIQARGRVPVVVGGTGLYVRSLTERTWQRHTAPQPRFRLWAEQATLPNLVSLLAATDPIASRSTDLKNRRRVVRALEILLFPSDATAPSFPRYQVLKVAINVPAAVLRRRITVRVDRMIRAGLIAEVATLVQRYGESAPGLQTIGYREVLLHLAGRLTLKETNAAIVRATWQYARRQYTWLRKEPQLVFASSPADARRIIASWLSRGT